jgi:hypothetical protein
MISALSTSSLPAIDGNSLFWVMAALILALAVAVVKLAGAVHRGRHVPAASQAAFPGDEPGFPRAVTRRQDDAPARPRRRRRGGRLLLGAALVAGVLFAADKVLHFSVPSAARDATSALDPKPTATASPKASPKVTATPPVHRLAPSPHAFTPPVTIAHAASHFPLSGTDIVVIAIAVLLAAAAYGMSRNRHRAG